MIALGSLSAYEDVQAIIKDKVGQFLSGEQKLRSLSTNSSVTISSKAQGLLVTQKQLEADLGQAQATVAKFQTGAWTIGEMIEASDTAYRMLQQIRDTDALANEAAGIIATDSIISMAYAPYALLAVAGIIVGAMMLKKK